MRVFQVFYGFGLTKHEVFRHCSTSMSKMLSIIYHGVLVSFSVMHTTASFELFILPKLQPGIQMMMAQDTYDQKKFDDFHFPTPSDSWFVCFLEPKEAIVRTLLAMFFMDPCFPG